MESKETPFNEWDPNATCLPENFLTTGKQEHYTCEGLYPWIYVLVVLCIAILLLLLSPCSSIRNILCGALRTIGFRKRKGFTNKDRKFIEKHLKPEKIVTPLIAQELITMDERDYIMEGSERNSKIERLLHIMDSKDEDSYRRFLVVIKEAYPALAEGKSYMSVGHTKALMVSRAAIVKDLDVSSTCIISPLYARGVLSDHDKEDIMATQTRHKQCEKFLDILSEKNDDAFDIVVDIFRKSNYKFLVEKLIKEANYIPHYKEADVPDTNTHKKPSASHVVINDVFEAECCNCPQKTDQKKQFLHGKIISIIKKIQDFLQFLRDNLRKQHRPTDAKQEHEQYVNEELLAIMKRKFFSNGKPVQSTIAISSGDFKLCGEIMGMSILQGGPAPNFMSTNVVSYITGGILLPEDNQNLHYKSLGESLLNATSDTEVRSILSKDPTLDVLQEIGYSGIPQRETRETAKAILQSLCIKDQLGEYLAQVLQIESGLAECGLINSIKSDPEIWRPVFEIGNMFTLSAEEILDQTTVEFSESQLVKEAEIDTYKYFCDTLEAIDTGATNPPRGIVTQKTWIFTHLNGGCISLDKYINALSRLGVSASEQDFPCVLNNLHNATFNKFLEILKDVAPECHEKCPVAKSSDGHS